MSQQHLRLGSVAPNFDAETTIGHINFHEWLGNSWAVLFSHPADFTPVCTTELGQVEKYNKQFQERGVKVLAVSVDGIDDHHKWIQDINEVNGVQVGFPIIADKERKVSKLYDMLDHEDHDPTNIVQGQPLTVRSVFIIDPAKKIRLTLTYPASCGRNFDEIVRVIDSLQLSDKHPVTTPANWKVGDRVIVHPKVSDAEAKQQFPEHEVLKPYLRLTPQPKN